MTMNPEPPRVYRNHHLGRRLTPHDCRSAMMLLTVVGDREPPDARPTWAQRQALKDLAHGLGARLSSVELTFLASAIEAEANTIRAAEEAG